MKKIFSLLLFIVCLQITKAQTYVTIPDANFAAWLQLKIPSAMNGNQMDIASPAVTNRAKIDITGQSITDLTGIQYFTSLDTFRYGNGIATTLPALPNSVTHIDIFAASFTSIVSLPNSLKEINCQANQLTSLPTLPNTLMFLNCNYNQISAIPAFSASLIKLECSGNLLTSLPALPTSIINIDCHDNQLTILPSLAPSLIDLNCYNNHLTTLPVLPNSLETFNCSYNQLTNLPALPNSLKTFYCTNNQFTNISMLPNLLENFVCNYNQLTNLPVLPNSLLGLGCSNNQITSLPLLPTLLVGLDCSHNQLMSLPLLPDSLDLLYCSHNQLTTLLSLPASLSSLICDHNNISCFPVFPNIYAIKPEMSPIITFDISSNPFTCLPNYIPAMDAGTLNFPLCTPGNVNGCSTGQGITGVVYHDVNQDCNKGVTEGGINNAVVKAYDNTNTFIGLASALVNKNYFITVPPGTYKVVLDTVNKPYRVQCVNPGVDSLITLTSSKLMEDSIDFAITCKPGFDIGFEWGRPRFNVFPGGTHTLTVVSGDLGHWNNLYCASGISGTVTFTITGPVTYIGPAPGALTPSVSGNVYTYTITDFGMVQNFTDFRLRFTTNTSAQTGDQICIDGLIVTPTGDYNMSNNTYHLCYEVGNSYDPNQKEVYPKEVAPGFNDWLTYTIYFRNIGTSAAINVRLLDTLETKLDPETFQVLSSSHSNMIDLTGNILNVRFPNIQLSSPIVSQQGALGFFRYRIKPKAGWVNDTIRNSANIYFDYNAPIVTNTAKTYFMTTTSVANNQLSGNFSIYPNPANSAIHIKITESMTALTTYRIKLTDVLGKEILNEKYKEEIDLSQLEKGIYVLSVYQDNQLLATKKVVKE